MPAAAVQTSPAEETFGRRLRLERERRRIALSSIAENTKISIALFEELERDNASHWPSGIFRRSFIRAYAQAIGIDADATTREFLQRFPDPNDADVALQLAPEATTPLDLPATPSTPGRSSTLRLTLEADDAFASKEILRAIRDRVVAVACDVACVSVIGLAMSIAVGSVWMPLCGAVATYFVGGVLILGTSPGVCLCTPASRRKTSARISFVSVKKAARSLMSAVGLERKRYIAHARILTPPTSLHGPYKNTP
jgi:transcriptional regulator with XRE-family HTH domain